MGRFAVPAYIFTPTKAKLMEAEEMNIQPRNINGGEASTMNLPPCLAVCALQNCGLCVAELWFVRCRIVVCALQNCGMCGVE